METKNPNNFVKRSLPKIGATLFLLAVIALVGYLIYKRERYAQMTNPSLHLAAPYYKKSGSNTIQCFICPNQCILQERQIGLCKAKQNIKGELYSTTYGQIAARHVDPIEKKPLYHFLPGTKVYSISASGCNFSCKNCQNWEISQKFPWEAETVLMTPEEVVAEALRTGSQSIAYTYGEPVVFYEFMLDTAKLAQKKGIKNIWVTNGYINPEPLAALLPYLDAANIDLKGFSEEFYQKITGGHLEPVLNTLKMTKEAGVEVEVTNLIIPGENDSEQMIKDLIIWVRDNLGTDTPLHFSRFHPAYKMINTPSTPVETLIKAREMAINLGLKYVYTGNIGWIEGNSTYCPDGSVAIKRSQFFVLENNLKDGMCPDGSQVYGVWE